MGSKTETKKASAPRLRFPGFVGECNWIELGKVTAFINQKINLAELEAAKYLSTENILPDFAGVEKTANKPENGGATRFIAGDLLISNIRPYLRKVWAAQWEGGSSNDVLVIRALGHLDPAYLAHALKNDDFIEYVMQGAKGLKMPRGDINAIRKYPIPLPSLPEQQHIAAALSSLDAIITAQVDKLAALRQHKQGLMQGLFPAEGELVPRLRFPEFEWVGEWMEKRLREVFIEVTRPLKMEDDQAYSLVTVKRRYGGVVRREKNLGKNILVKTQFLIEQGDFLISKRQIVHSACGVVPKHLSGSIVSNEYSVLRAKEGYCVYFLDYFTRQPDLAQSFNLSSNGIVIEKMLFNLKDWLNRKFLFPTLPEQQRIAAALSSLDELIDAQGEKVAALQEFKRGLMQGLFPRAGEE